jgi:hypothetical protein
VARGVPEVVDLTLAISNQQQALATKRKLDIMDAPIDDADDTENKSRKRRATNVDETTEEGSYWDSPEAKKLFLGTTTDERSVQEVLKQRIQRLQAVNRSSDGWRDIIERHDVDNLCSPHDVFIIRQRCQILCLAYMFALEEMNSTQWFNCCAQAVYESNRMGVEAATNKRTVAGWNVLLRANREHFPQPDPTIHKHKKPLPDLLEYFREEIMEPWSEYCIQNLADLTVESARNELITKIIPGCWNKVASRTSDAGDSSTSLNSTSPNSTNDDHHATLQESTTSTSLKRECVLLKGYVDTPISWATSRRWLQRLGYHYDLRKKTFFVDGHERPNVVAHRNEFCTRYLTCLEPRTHRWIQVTKETVEQWKSEKKISDNGGLHNGFAYLDNSGTEMIEFHVDDYDFLPLVAEEMGFGLYGGNLSVRMPPRSKPLMIFGQDESVFAQFLLKSKQWVSPFGQRALLPKTDGMSLMISAFQSRETGFGLTINPMQMEEINETRRGKNYVDLDAALAVNGQVQKKDLKQSPFVVSFELGVNNEGYWTYNHMSIQFEDCVDCLKVVYPHFEFVFLFDHSQGHAKKLTGGLDAYCMNKGYGGAQPIMRESQIKEQDGYIGMYPHTLNVGDNQSFVFNSGDTGPFWMTPQEQELNRHDRILPPTAGNPKMRNKTISELKVDLAPFEILNSRRQYRLKELQVLATERNLNTQIERIRERKGWEGQPKGLLHTLWERGWIDANNLDKYTIEIAKDENGDIVEGGEQWSLKYLMATCQDFAGELTALQHVGQVLGVSVLITPKFHAEMAGEGIEYSWAVTKSVYRKMPLESKKGKDSFKALVSECTSRDVLKTGVVRKLSKQARAYICAYFILQKQQLNNNNSIVLTLPLIDRLMKIFKTHRAAVDFDAGFVQSVIPPEIEDVVQFALKKNEAPIQEAEG